MKCYISSIACCFQSGPLKKLKIGTARVSLSLEIHTGGELYWSGKSSWGKDQKFLPSVGDVCIFSWNHPFCQYCFRNLLWNKFCLYQERKKCPGTFYYSFLKLWKVFWRCMCLVRNYKSIFLLTGSALNFSKKLRLDVKIGQLMRTENFWGLSHYLGFSKIKPKVKNALCYFFLRSQIAVWALKRMRAYLS